jgi:hypothetical protein
MDQQADAGRFGSARKHRRSPHWAPGPTSATPSYAGGQAKARSSFPVRHCAHLDDINSRLKPSEECRWAGLGGTGQMAAVRCVLDISGCTGLRIGNLDRTNRIQLELDPAVQLETQRTSRIRIPLECCALWTACLPLFHLHMLPLGAQSHI